MTEPQLRVVVEAKLAVRWSPQQIAGWLPLAYPQDPVMRVQRCLCTGRAMRYPRGKRLP